MAGPGIDLGSVWASVGLRLDNLFRGVSQAQGAMRNLDRSMVSQAQATSNRVSSIFDNLGRSLERLFATAFSVYAIRRFTSALDGLAATAFQAQAGLNIFARQVARTGQDLDAALRLLGGLANELRVPQEVLARNAAELLRYGYSVQQVVDIFRGAVASGLLVGRTTVESINTVTEALVSQRSVLLNVLGITENLEPAFVRYARSLGKTADELTNSERATAAWQMITRATAAEVQDLNLLLEGYGGAVADVGTQSFNLRRVLGEALLPAVTNVRKAWADMLNTLARLAQTAEVRSAIQAIGNAFTSILGTLRDGLQWFTAHRDLIRELAERVIPAFIAVLSVRLAQSLAALAKNLLIVAGRYTLIIGAVALLIEAIRMLDEATGQSMIGKFFDFVGKQVAWLVAEIQAGWEWLTTGKISAETKRRLDETGRAYDEASRRFKEGLSRVFDVARDPATLWNRLLEVGRQRFEELRRLLAGEPLPELQPVQPTVMPSTMVGGTQDAGAEGATLKLDDVIKRWQQARALVELGHRATVDLGNGVRELHGSVDEFLFAYADWLAVIVRGQNTLFAGTANQARAAAELLDVLRELYEKFPQKAAQRFPRELAGLIAETLAKEQDQVGRAIQDLMLETQEIEIPFRAERERIETQYRDLRDRIVRAFVGFPEIAQDALNKLDAWREAKLADIARREQEAEDRRNDEHVRSLLKRVEREAELYDWSAAQQADAIDQILSRERMSAELREELTHRVALLRKQAAEEAAEMERRGAEEAMRLADEATDAWVKAIERRAELENWGAAKTAEALEGVLRLATMSAERRAELEYRVAILRKQAAEEEAAERARLLTEQARREIAYIREREASLFAQRDALRRLAQEYAVRGPEARQAVELITQAVDELNGEIDKLQENVRQGLLTLAERARPTWEARWTVSAEDVTAGARGAIEAIRLTSSSLAEQRARLEELLASYEALGETGRDAAKIVRDEIERVNAAIVEQAAKFVEIQSFMRQQAGKATAETLEDTRRTYAEIERLRMTDRQRRVADIEAQAAELRGLGVDEITIREWVAAQLKLLDAEAAQARIEQQKRAAAEIRRAWANILLGPFADPLARLVEGFRAFRVGERLAEAFGSLRRVFADTLPGALHDGLSKVLAWLREQARSVGDWFRAGLSWLGQQASGAFGALGSALGSAGAAAGAGASGALGALAAPASAAASALAGLAGAVASFLAVALEASPQFRRFIDTLGLVFRDVASALGGLLEPLIPVIHEFRQAFEPILQALYPVFRAFGNIIAQIVRALVPFFVVIAQLLLPVLRALWPVFKLIGEVIITVLAFVGEAWNTFANAINWLLGWLGVNLPTIDTGAIYEARERLRQTEWPKEGEELPSSEADESARGYQIAQITGPTRDFFAELFRPISNLSILSGLFDNLLKAVYSVRDLLASAIDTSLADAADALAAAATSLSDAAMQLVAAVEALTASLRSEGGALVVELVQSIEVARVTSMAIAQVDMIQVAQAQTVQVVGGQMRSPFDWLLGLRGVGA